MFQRLARKYPWNVILPLLLHQQPYKWYLQILPLPTPTQGKLTTISTTTNDADGEQSGMGTAALIGVGIAVLIAIFVAAIWLTRKTEEEVERDIFDYCPACDGELEGDENRCPHCSFNLAKARKQFHACHACGESVLI